MALNIWEFRSGERIRRHFDGYVTDVTDSNRFQKVSIKELPRVGFLKQPHIRHIRHTGTFRSVLLDCWRKYRNIIRPFKEFSYLLNPVGRQNFRVWC